MTKPHHTFDVTALLLVVGAWLQYLPLLAAGLAALWYFVQIWESKTAVCIKERLKRKWK
jgi:hypothetical protein